MVNTLTDVLSQSLHDTEMLIVKKVLEKNSHITEIQNDKKNTQLLIIQLK